MGIKDDVNSCLSRMRNIGGTGKGTYGEDAALKVCEQLYQDQGGILIKSYTYKTEDNLPGNIKKGANGELYFENLGGYTEIDVLLITPYRIFPIEVKAYKASTIHLEDKGISGVNIKNKSPVHQNEMHCRHLYPKLFSVIPDGLTKYIVPIVVFVDKCTLVDERSDWQKAYVPATILNNLRALIDYYNKPSEFRLDLDAIDRYLLKAQLSAEKKFPVRKM